MKIAIRTLTKSMTFMMTVGCFALCCTAIGDTALASEPTAAEAPPATGQSITHWSVSLPVGYSDLDVSKLSGAKILYMRIRFAAETLCKSAATWGKKEGEACVSKAVNDAVAGVNAPLLTQYSQLRSKGDKAGLVQLAKTN
jgi:UrcA family protein